MRPSTAFGLCAQGTTDRERDASWQGSSRLRSLSSLGGAPGTGGLPTRATAGSCSAVRPGKPSGASTTAARWWTATRASSGPSTRPSATRLVSSSPPSISSARSCAAAPRRSRTAPARFTTGRSTSAPSTWPACRGARACNRGVRGTTGASSIPSPGVLHGAGRQHDPWCVRLQSAFLRRRLRRGEPWRREHPLEPRPWRTCPRPLPHRCPNPFGSRRPRPANSPRALTRSRAARRRPGLRRARHRSSAC